MGFRLPSSVRYLPRRAHIFSTAAVVYAILKITQLLNRAFRRNEEQCDNAWIKANTRAAEQILRTSTARRGLWIKCCQYVAARSDALPPEYSTVLSKSLDDCPPTPPVQVIETVTNQLQETPFGIEFQSKNGRLVTISDVFEGFDPARPIASASIAQVHVATLKTSGQRVVLKVQHPGIRPMLLQDLQDLKTLLTWIAGAEPKYDMRPVLDAWIRMVPLETNFLNEMANLQAVKTTLSTAPDHLMADAYVPEPMPHLTSDKLFVMEYIDGCKVTDIETIDKYSVNRDELITNITRSFGNQLFVGHVFSGDPHPGNFLIHELEDGGVPVLLDFGICVKVEEDVRCGFARLILAAIDNDSYSIVKALSEVGVNLNRADPTASLDIIKYLFRTTAPQEESRKEQNAMKEKLEKNNSQMERNARDTPIHQVFADEPMPEDVEKPGKRESRSPVDSFPGDLVFFFRSLGMLRGLAVKMDVRHSYLDVLRPFAEHAIKVSCPEQDQMKEVVYRPVFTSGRFDALTAARVLQRVFHILHEKEMMIGMQVAAYKNGKLVLNIASGQRGRYDLRPVTTKSLFNSFSSTKGLTAILFASLQDDYDVQYHDLVTKYWPEYGQNGKESTTIAHILSHSAGLAQALPEDMNMLRLRDDWKGIIEHLETSRPAHVPGERSEYHVLTFGWLVAGLIMKITGHTYQNHLRKLVKEFGIEDECFCGTMPEDLLPDVSGSRVASLSSSIINDIQRGPIGKAIAHVKTGNCSNKKYDSKDKTSKAAEDIGGVRNPQEEAKAILNNLNVPATGLSQAPAYLLDLNFFNHPVLRAGFVPSANGHFTARALAMLFAAVGNKGAVDNKELLKPDRVEKMQQMFCKIDPEGRRAWGAGVTLYDTVDKSGKLTKHGAIGHGGIGGSFAFAVPSEKFSMAVTLNKLNALSVSSAVAIVVVCRIMKIPMPVWYHDFGKLIMKTLKEDGPVELESEAAVMEKLFRSGGESDLMKMLIG
ncbi:putative aarF domain-containing protein kinase 1 [Gracilariopsis chorda]|uniref:Putative aarF domain-containing protein kinase 1 n=1 Tax=Gracilariopsis chorda TaxID=448386 RepID=A0A2V3ITD2_9FLOR|nr:putative aarF domain-containing protein kinase 1 [Gracilariopsis chorda]|eukprot:PXF45375.1 putative aarF domain-containing protein kinase 1 [Gracilariopsis chorda]